MNFDETVNMLAVDLNPKSSGHWLRVGFAIAIASVGLADIILSRFVREGPWEWMPLLMVFGGVGILFTSTVISVAKALLPWKTK